MAIAFDASTNTSTETGGTSLTFSHTCSGANRILFVGIRLQNGSDLVSGVTYNSVAMTRVDYVVDTIPRGAYLYALTNPASGANNVVISLSSTGDLDARSESFTGVQPGAVDSHATGTANGVETLSATTTTIADNCWAVGFFHQNVTGSPNANSGTTLRGSGDSVIMGDSNGVIHPAGSKSLGINWTGSGNGKGGCVIASFAPFDISALGWRGDFPDILLDTIVESIDSGFMPPSPANPTDPTPN